MNEPLSNIVCIACSIFKNELSTLAKRGDIPFPVRYLNSILHMNPEILHDELARRIDEELGNLHDAGLYNHIRTLGSPQGAWLVVDGKKVLNF